MDAAALDGFGESVVQAFRAIASTTRSHADSDSRRGGNELRQAGFAHSTEGANVLNARHQSLSPSTARISRCRVRSLTWPQMRWFTSTTGARAHCPKQATVRTVNFWSGVVSRV